MAVQIQKVRQNRSESCKKPNAGKKVDLTKIQLWHMKKIIELSKMSKNEAKYPRSSWTSTHENRTIICSLMTSFSLFSTCEQENTAENLELRHVYIPSTFSKIFLAVEVLPII